MFVVEHIFLNEDDDIEYFIESIDDDGYFDSVKEEELKPAHLKLKPNDKVLHQKEEGVFTVIKPLVVHRTADNTIETAVIGYLIEDETGFTLMEYETKLRKISRSSHIQTRKLSYEEEVDWLLDLYGFTKDKQYLEKLRKLEGDDDGCRR